MKNGLLYKFFLLSLAVGEKTVAICRIFAIEFAPETSLIFIFINISVYELYFVTEFLYHVVVATSIFSLIFFIIF